MSEPQESFENRLRALPLGEPSPALRNRTLNAATAAAAASGRPGWAVWTAAAVMALCAGLNLCLDTRPTTHRSEPPMQTAVAHEDPAMKDLEALAGRPLYRRSVRCADGRSILETRRQLEALLGS